MKLFLVLMSVVALSTAEIYSKEHEDLDIKAQIPSTDSLRSYYEYFTDNKGPKNEVQGSYVQGSYKKDLPEAVLKACANCTPDQKRILNRFLVGLKQFPDRYEAFRKTFDPENKYFDALETAVANS